jgi:Sec-independent protein translocase protein TatA
LFALIVITVLIVLFLGGERLTAIGKGLGDGVRGYRKARRQSDPPAAKPQPPQVQESPPKLLPAKGESSASRSDDSDS